MTRRSALFLVAASLSLALFAVICVWLQDINRGADRPTSAAEFSEQRWSTDKSHRYDMIDSLLTQKLKSAKTAEEVFRLLGKPDVSWNEAGTSNVMYALGSQRDYPAERTRGSTKGVDIDIWYLSIQFTNGLVIKLKVIST